MNTLLGEVNLEKGACIISNNTGKVMEAAAQALEGLAAAAVEVPGEYAPEYEISSLAGEAVEETTADEVILVSEKNNNKRVYGGDGADIFMVKGAEKTEVNNCKGVNSFSGYVQTQGLGIANIGIGSQGINYNGSNGQDIVNLTDGTGDNCKVLTHDGNDIITVKGGKNHTLQGGAGNDKYVIEALKAGGVYSIVQTDAAVKDRDTLNLSGFKSQDFFVEAVSGQDLILTLVGNKAQVRIVDWYNSPLTYVVFDDMRVKVSELAQAKGYSSYNLKLEGEYIFSGNNKVKANGVSLANKTSMDKLTVEGNDTLVKVNGGAVTVNGGNGLQIDNTVNKGEVTINGGNNIAFKGSAGDDYLKIYGGTGLVAELGAGKDQVQVYGGSDNTLVFGTADEQKSITLQANTGDNYTIVADKSENAIAVYGGSNHSITCGSYSDTITIDNAQGSGYVINTGDGDDYVELKAGQVKLLEMGEGNQTLVLVNGTIDEIRSQGDLKTLVRGGTIYINEKTRNLPILESGENTVYFSNVNLESFSGGTGNDTFIIESGYIHQLKGGKGSDTYTFNTLLKGKEYIIDQGLGEGVRPLNSEKDYLNLNSYDSADFSVRKDDKGDIILTHKTLNTDIRITGWEDNALTSISFKDKVVSGRAIDTVTGIGEDGISQVQILKDFMEVLDHTVASGTRAMDEAITACSRGLYGSAQELIDAFINDCVNHGGSTTTEQKKFLLDYCGINLDNTDTGAISGADAGGPIVKTAASIVEEPKDLTVEDIQYNFTDKISASNFWSGYGQKEYTCAKVNCNGEDITFYWDESQVKNLVTRGLISNVEVLNKMIAGVIQAWAEPGFNLISESYGMSLTEEGSNLVKAGDGSKAIMLCMDYASPTVTSTYLSGNSYSWVAAMASSVNSGFVIGGEITNTVRQSLVINTYYYQGGFRDINGRPATSSLSSQYLDRVLAHEMVHGTMSANINGFNSLPSFLKEGLAELVHGVDDTRRYEMLSAADTNWRMSWSNGDVTGQRELLEKIFNLNTPSYTLSSYSYGAGFALLRYMAKNVADYSKNLSWGDFDYAGYIDALKQYELEMNAEAAGMEPGKEKIYVDFFDASRLPITGNC